MKNVAIVLSGCGVLDGSEIHEAVITLNAVENCGAKAHFFAPNTEQLDVVDHLTGKPLCQKRNVLTESARIARGACTDLSKYSPEDFSALIFIGGFGAAKNLCNFAMEGENCTVNGCVAAAIDKNLSAKKPIGFLCISPVIAARHISNGVKLTVGNDAATAKAVEAMGATHVNCDVSSFVFDGKFNVYSTPAYMLAQNTVELAAGVNAMVKAMLGA